LVVLPLTVHPLLPEKATLQISPKWELSLFDGEDHCAQWGWQRTEENSEMPKSGQV
jgi:hypothetical protein